MVTKELQNTTLSKKYYRNNTMNVTENKRTFKVDNINTEGIKLKPLKDKGAIDFYIRDNSLTFSIPIKEHHFVSDDLYVNSILQDIKTVLWSWHE